MIATRWFHARRGLVVGLLTAANSTGQLIFLPLMSHVAMDGLALGDGRAGAARR